LQWGKQGKEGIGSGKKKGGKEKKLSKKKKRDQQMPLCFIPAGRKKGEKEILTPQERRGEKKNKAYILIRPHIAGKKEKRK